MRKSIGLLVIVASLAVLGGRIYQRAVFSQQVSGHLKNAADANTVGLALEELTIAVDYLEAHDITSGHTSVLWKTPDEDVGFWYRNLKASQQELLNLENPTALEKTNTLMKLRETLLDTGEKTRVTVPDGVSAYPNNAIWLVATWAALIGLLWGVVLVVSKEAWNTPAEAKEKA